MLRISKTIQPIIPRTHKNHLRLPQSGIFSPLPKPNTFVVKQMHNFKWATILQTAKRISRQLGRIIEDKSFCEIEYIYRSSTLCTLSLKYSSIFEMTSSTRTKWRLQIAVLLSLSSLHCKLSLWNSTLLSRR